MVISIILVLVVAIIAVTSIKKNTTYGLFQSTVLGLLCVIPYLLGMVVDALQFGVAMLFKLAFALGGSSVEELIESHLMKKGVKVKVVKGDDGKH
jgi:Na+-translocating ferredoxin:NAD+ oxidoreductase RnfD subunit